jgi:hypothetical protein
MQTTAEEVTSTSSGFLLVMRHIRQVVPFYYVGRASVIELPSALEERGQHCLRRLPHEEFDGLGRARLDGG